jgi:hypothetical protein
MEWVPSSGISEQQAGHGIPAPQPQAPCSQTPLPTAPV